MKHFRLSRWHKWLKRGLALLLGVMLFAKAGVARTQSNHLVNDSVTISQDTNQGNTTEVYWLLEEGLRLLEKEDLESLQQALEYFNQALHLSRDMNDRVVKSGVLYSIGRVYRALDEVQKAVEYFTQALLLIRNMNSQVEEAVILNSIGNAYDDLDEKQKALEYFYQALTLFRAEGDQREAAVLYSIGTVYRDLDEAQKALGYFYQALFLIHNMNSQVEEAVILNSIGNAYDDLDEKQKALEYFYQALTLFRAEGDQREAAVLNNIGVIYYDLGEAQKALDYFTQALPLIRNDLGETQKALMHSSHNIFYTMGRIYSGLGEVQKALECFTQALLLAQDMNDQVAEAVVLHSIGLVYNDLGVNQTALEYFTQAMTLFRAEGDQGGEANALNSIGTIYYRLGANQTAAEYFIQAAFLAREVNAQIVESFALHNIGNIYHDLGVNQTAVEYFTQAMLLARAEDARSDASILNSLASVYYDLSEEQKSLEYYNQALQVSRDVEDQRGEAIILVNIASIYRDQDRTDMALKNVNAAISIIEELRTKIGSDELQASYFSTKQDAYQFKIDLSVQMGQTSEAFDTSERSRTRTLIELLAESNINPGQATDDPVLKALYERQQELENQLAARENLIQTAESEAARERYQQEFRQLELELKSVIEPQIKQKDPAYAAIRYPTPLTLDQVQRNVLDDDTVLLQYAVGDERSYLFSVTKAEMKSYTLPSSTGIEPIAQEFLNALKAGRRDSDLLQPAACLRQKILPKGVLQLAAGKKLVIAADGILQTIPFAALPLSDLNAPEPDACDADTFNRDSSQTYQPLIEQYEIVNIPSITAVQILRQQQQTPAPKTLSIFADPVLTTDPRYTGQGPEATCAANLETTHAANAVPPETLPIELQVALRSTDGILAPLPCTRSEAEAILKEINDPGQTFAALDYDVTQGRVLETPLSQYRIVHFATHGLVDNRNPQFSGLVLSQVDRQGNLVEDYQLQLNDIFNLKLNADLVVLSACETGMGQNMRGEGIIGITRGFMYAGAKRVMTSFWRVEDGSTAELMSRFYHFMLQEKLSPPMALRQAQLEMRKKPTSRANQWAAFTIQGEWN